MLAEGIDTAIDRALEHLSHVEAIIVDFDIDVIDRAQLPGAPGRAAGRPSGRSTSSAPPAGSRRRSRVRLVDLTEFDPSLDLSDISALDRRPLGLRDPRRLQHARAMNETDPALAAAFKEAMRRVAATVNVISICVDGKPMGITATAVSVVSMDPPSLLVCVNQAASVHP